MATGTIPLSSCSYTDSLYKFKICIHILWILNNIVDSYKWTVSGSSWPASIFLSFSLPEYNPRAACTPTTPNLMKFSICFAHGSRSIRNTINHNNQIASTRRNPSHILNFHSVEGDKLGSLYSVTFHMLNSLLRSTACARPLAVPSKSYIVSMEMRFWCLSPADNGLYGLCFSYTFMYMANTLSCRNPAFHSAFLLWMSASFAQGWGWWKLKIVYPRRWLKRRYVGCN